MDEQFLAKDYDFYVVTITSIAMFSFSCFGSIIVMIRTFRQWKFIKTNCFINSKNKLMMNYKLPFYTSIIGNKLFINSLLYLKL